MLCKNALLVCTVLGKRNSRSRSCATCFPSQCRTRHDYLQTTHERRNISKIDAISSARKTTEERRHQYLQVRTTPSAERLLPAIMEAKEHLHHHQLWLPRRSSFSFFFFCCSQVPHYHPERCHALPARRKAHKPKHRRRRTQPRLLTQKPRNRKTKKIYSTTGTRHTHKSANQKNIHIYTHIW